MIQITIYTPIELQAILSTLLMELGASGIEEQEDVLIAYFSAKNEANQAIQQLQSNFGLAYEVNELEDKNWNQVWESNYQPIYVDDFCQIIASFHEKRDGFEHTIEINPKMAFGTGHHATTLMMIQALRELDCKNKTVLDLGCGTGILGILSRLEGAKQVLAVDIEEHVKNLVEENLLLNGVDRVKVVHGTIDGVTESYDIILANINRNVLLQDAEKITNHLAENGQLVLSGFYENDLELIRKKYETNTLRILNVSENSGWVCAKFAK